MANINDGDLISLIGSISSNTGFQKAHIIGSSFATKFKSSWFGKLFANYELR